MKQKKEIVETKKRFFRKNVLASKSKFERTQRVESLILQTLGYSSLFNYPLSLYQLSNLLITKRRIGLPVLSNSLDYLIKNSKVKERDRKYYLYKTKTVSWEEREKNSKSLFLDAQHAANILKRIPWILFIGVTGSLAAFNAIKNDDIDFFIITKKSRVWITRGFVFFVLKVLGILRTDMKPSRMICPNIFVGEDVLSWDKTKRNIYVAHEIVMMHPIFDRDDFYFRFLQKNDWVFKYFGNFPRNEIVLKAHRFHKNWLVSALDKFAFNMQIRYMKKKQTSEITKRNFIHFNKVDNTETVLSGLGKIRGRLGLKKKTS